MNNYNYRGYEEGHVFTVSQLTEFIKESCDKFGIDLVYGGKNLEYLNIPCAFDIETSSFMTKKNGKEIKYATMYIWQFGMNGSVIYGRTWEEFMEVLGTIDEYLELSEERRMIIYVHNLMFEFQFLCKWIEWDKIFAPHKRRPLYARVGGFEFRCSYYLSNYSLEYIGSDMLHKYPIKKLVGNLDYSKIRHSKTPLTQEELDYCINDVKVVMSYIQERIETDGDIAKIPLTNTGYVRNYCREYCFYNKASKKEDKKKEILEYKTIINSLKISDENEYKQLKRGFSGGFTHASILHVNKILENVGSADLTSSYPFTMVAQYFPMSSGRFIGNVSGADFEECLRKYCCLFEVSFYNLKPLVDYENYIPSFKCYKKGNIVENNLRIVSADFCALTCTELDFDIISKFYTWDYIEVNNMRIYERGLLPKSFILSILQLYENKTKLKGLAGKEIEYLVSKGMINSAYGMAVTDIIRDNFDFIDGQWYKITGDPEKQLKKYNSNFNRFLSYAWGVWVTAHARHNLFEAILEFKEDYVYSDTDSIKGINFDKHLKFFENYNREVEMQLLDMCSEYNIDYNLCSPKTIKGKEKLIGVWEIEEGYKQFKTCGAKRYIYTYNDNYLNFTTAGLNKKLSVPYLLAKWNNIDFESETFKKILSAYNPNDINYESNRKWLVDYGLDYDMIFEEYGDGLFIPEEYSGRTEAVYNDFELYGMLVDYLGNPYYYHELSSLYIGKSHYYMSIVDQYIKLINKVQEMII